MAKGSGGTRASSAGSPKGLSNNNVQGGVKYDRQYYEASQQEFDQMDKTMRATAKSKKWESDYMGVFKDYGMDAPIGRVRLQTVVDGTGDGGVVNYYEARITSSLLANTSTDVGKKYNLDLTSLENKLKGRRFKLADEAIEYLDAAVKRINKKYKGKI